MEDETERDFRQELADLRKQVCANRKIIKELRSNLNAFRMRVARESPLWGDWGPAGPNYFGDN